MNALLSTLALHARPLPVAAQSARVAAVQVQGFVGAHPGAPVS